MAAAYDDSDSELESNDESLMEIGFAEECESWKLLSKYFPSKIGGKPAWLNLKDLPSPPSQLLCACCQKPLVFLLQVYAPIEGIDKCFHRTIFIFVCKDPKCCKNNKSDNFSVLRCQVPRANDCYSFEPYVEDENDPEPTAEKYNKLCAVCGCLGPLRCSRCQSKYYCCAIHQRIDWSSGHKEECKNMTSGDVSKSKGSEAFTFPEHEIVTEEELAMKTPEKSEHKKMNEYRQFMKTGTDMSLMEEDAKQIEQFQSLNAEENKKFQKFRDRISAQSDQILRYKINGKPLWISKKHVPQPHQIPACSCGAPRRFEFQIMPQLLNYLKVDTVDHSLDWGTLVIYTCSQNCDNEFAYRTEFLWKQG